MGVWIAHHPALTHPGLTHLELGFHQHHQLRHGLGRQQSLEGWQHQAKGNERHIRHGQIGPWISFAVEISCHQMAQVGALLQHHTPIAAQAPGRLAIAHINAIDPLGTVLQQAIGKAAGGNSPIDAHPTAHLQGEGLKGRQELFATARHKAGRMLNLQLQLGGHIGAGLIEHLITGTHPTGPNQLLGLLARGHQPAGQELQIQALLAGHGRRGAASTLPGCDQTIWETEHIPSKRACWRKTS